MSAPFPKSTPRCQWSNSPVRASAIASTVHLYIDEMSSPQRESARPQREPGCSSTRASPSSLSLSLSLSLRVRAGLIRTRRSALAKPGAVKRTSESTKSLINFADLRRFLVKSPKTSSFPRGRWRRLKMDSTTRIAVRELTKIDGVADFSHKHLKY